MDNENAVAVVPEVRYDLAMARDPKQVLAEATSAAKALQSVVSQRKGAVVFNGKQYLTFEDFQTLGRFYGVTARIVSTELVEIDGVKGFIARAEAINTQTGAVVSAAESMCLNDEPTWARKPLFQLRSMAQTRASAKSLRNCLAWVAVLAGYEPSVAEEMTGDEQPAKEPIKPPTPKVSPAVAQTFGADASKSFEFIPSVVTEKAGTKGPRFGIKAPDESWYNTFDANFGAIAKAAKESKTAIRGTWKASGSEGQYKDIVTLTA